MHGRSVGRLSGIDRMAAVRRGARRRTMKLLTIAASFDLEITDRSMDNRSDIWRGIDAIKARFIDLSDKVWGMPEVCYTEARSAAEHLAELRHQGFRITEQVAGIPTAVMGEWGEGGPVIAFMGNMTRCRASARRRASRSIVRSRPVATAMAAVTICSVPQLSSPRRR